jgi:hypothetical protein
MMWFDELQPGASWSRLWSGYILCAACRGIRRTNEHCQGCHAPPLDTSRRERVRIGDREVELAPVFMGAEGRYEDWVYLRMLENEWKRPIGDADRFLDIAEQHRPSPRAVIVIVFWTYFETRIERLLREAMRDLPIAVTNELLGRHASIGARLDRLYKILFQTTYMHDLAELGFDDVATMLRDLQERRNQFTHGDPAAIDEGLVSSVVSALRDEHESWIAVFNRRVARKR